MPIEKKVLKSKPICKVTFKLDNPNAKDVKLVGDFNDWIIEANPMKKSKEGIFHTTIDLKIGGNYEFKYIVDNVYTNDSNPDDLIFNDYAGDQNSVVKV